MRVAFLIPAPERAGVAAGHAARLREHHGVDAVVLTPGEAGGGERFDVAVATSWETAARVRDDVAADRYAYLVQSMDDRLFPPGSPEAAAAAATHELPLAAIADARWIVEQLTALRGDDAEVTYVAHGIDKDVFSIPDAPAPSADGPLRVLVVGRRSAPHEGVEEALAAAGAMREPAEVTLVDPDGEAGPRSPAEMAEAYSRADVVLSLARVAGVPLPPLEGFHRGATCVTTPVTGHDEYVVDGRNALLTSWDDERGTSRLLDLLARDRGLLHALRVEALETARAWPSAEQSTAMLLSALEGRR